MKILYRCLTVVYALLMGASAIMVDAEMPLWPRILTLLCAVCLLASLRWWQLLPVGVLGLLAAALVNGLVMYGQIHFSHLAFRLLVSVLLLGLWWRLGRPGSAGSLQQ
ncbi:hypothetical protein CRD60_04475 [Bifidobacterium aemilianum]|uniref:Uncharacterized protein n=1 Tax=Bifidobacterium aemilianum TaxID=2493120 RepID=A0A366K7Y5_9BIFI|nr:hypothetical protein CRD60_04475 [Bifidobacterium aemilianum]